MDNTKIMELRLETKVKILELLELQKMLLDNDIETVEAIDAVIQGRINGHEAFVKGLGLND